MFSMNYLNKYALSLAKQIHRDKEKKGKDYHIDKQSVLELSEFDYVSDSSFLLWVGEGKAKDAQFHPVLCVREDSFSQEIMTTCLKWWYIRTKSASQGWGLVWQSRGMWFRKVVVLAPIDKCFLSVMRRKSCSAYCHSSAEFPIFSH